MVTRVRYFFPDKMNLTLPEFEPVTPRKWIEHFSITTKLLPSRLK